MNLRLTCAAFLILMSCSAQAQLRYGFKTGLNFAHIDGPSETDASGKSLESHKNITGFHIGMTFGYKFVDHFGVRGEFLYSKKGTEYTFEGPSFRTFRYTNGGTVTTGNEKLLLKVNNSYFDLPVMAYGRFGHFEISGGFYAGVLIQTIGEGSLKYTDGVDAQNAGNKIISPNPVQFNLSYNFRKDDPLGGIGSDVQIVKFNSRSIEVPKTIGAYYDYPEDKGNLYNSFDYGLVGGLSYYISSSLYIHARIQYGLGDVTNNKADASHSKYEGNGNLVFSQDKDRNFVIQASVGFTF